MAYELPKDLKYKEKIVANLTWKQTLYLGTGILIGSLTLLIDSLPLFLRATVFTAASLTGAIFAFTRLERSLKDRHIYWKTVSEAGYLDQEALNFIDVETVENQIAEKNNGSKYSVVEVEPVNLQIRSRKEVEQIIHQYEDFLNSLNFPVHINIKTVDQLLEIDNYFDQYRDKVEKMVSETGNKDFQTYYREYQKFWKNYIEEHGIQKRKYYIIIPSTETCWSEAEKELERRTGLVLDKLPTQLAARRLTTSEILKLLANEFGDTVDVDNTYFSPVSLHKKQREKGGSFQ